MKKKRLLIIVLCAVVVIAIGGLVSWSYVVRSQRTALAPMAPTTGKIKFAAVEPIAGSEPVAPAEAVVAQVSSYVVKPDLSNISNLDQFGEFTGKQKALLAKNAFFVSPSDEIQLYHIYEVNDYMQIPSFITTDSVLQVYHIFYDYTLRTTEAKKLYPILEDLTRHMLSESVSLYGRLSEEEVKQAALKNVAYFAVAASVLQLEVDIPAEAREMVEEELEKIEAHSSRAAMSIFPYELDYTQFIPRGHYTRTEQFKRFFKAMMWYGLVPFAIAVDRDWLPEQIRQGAIITYLLDETQVGEEKAIALWDRIYEPTAFYVGAADDLTPLDYRDAIVKTYGTGFQPKELADEAKLREFYEELLKLRGPEIKTALVGIPGGKQFRFMGQRYIPDSEMLQELSAWPVRSFPKGLDVLAVLDSARAYDILINVYEEAERWSEYPDEVAKLREKFGKLEAAKWTSNLYYGWLWSMKSLLETFGEGYPSFMRNEAWVDKSLNTSLATWAELRHDTILYGKQSGVECGGGEEPPPPPTGYVEPNVQFYRRLRKLTQMSRDGLSERGLLTGQVSSKFDYLADLLTFLERVSRKELANETLTPQEYNQIKIFGAQLEYLTLSIAEGDILSETDKDMAVIADVHTSSGEALEEGVGHANEIYVVVPIGEELVLTRGAVFSYYEFTHPSADRLTDEKWQEMLKKRQAPPPPVWTESFLTGPKEELPKPRKVYSSGC